MSRKDFRHLVLLVPALLLLWGCEAKDPGSPAANQAPETRLVVAPMMQDTTFVFHTDTTWFSPDSFQVDTVAVDTSIVKHHPDHFVSPSPVFWVQWFGNDPDGTVAGYWIQVDGGTPVWTTSGDSAIAFEADTPDPNDPTLMRQNHTLSIAAQDNEGLKDPTPATRTFESINYPPSLDHFTADFQDSAQVGPGISFTVEWSDPNPSGALFQVSIDDEVVAPWDERSTWQFCDVNDPDILSVIEEGEVQPVDAAALTAGFHTIKVELKDLGGAEAEPMARTVEVIAETAPVMTTVSSTYGTSDYYPDGSVFYREDIVTNFTMEGSAAAYNGKVNSYRYRFHYREIPEEPEDTLWGDWSDWSAWGGAEFQKSNLDVGEYEFAVQCRDFTGALSDTLVYQAAIVEADLDNQTILVVDETRDGNGRPGSPDDQQCDDFYAEILTGLVEQGWDVNVVDYATHQVDGESFVSPLDVFDRRIIIWHGDDKSSVLLGDNTGLLSDYLEFGGRLVVSGWDVMKAFTTESEAAFSATSFAYKYLRVAAARQNGEKDFIGITGVDYPDVNLDTEKIPASWAGVDKCWELTPAWRAATIGTFNSAVADPEFQGMSACVANLSPVNPWKTVTLGFPLYFMMNDEAKTFIERVVGDLDQ